MNIDADVQSSWNELSESWEQCVSDDLLSTSAFVPLLWATPRLGTRNAASSISEGFFPDAKELVAAMILTVHHDEFTAYVSFDVSPGQ